MSNDGQWFGYRLAPGEGDAEIVVKKTRGGEADKDKERTFAVGEAPAAPAGGGGRGGEAPGGGSPTLAFSEDGKWAAFTTYPTRREAQRLRRQRRPIQSSVTIVNLATGEKKEYPKIRRFAFSGDASTWIALQRFSRRRRPAAAGAAAPAEAARRRGRCRPRAARPSVPRGTDLILRDLATGPELNVGNVGEFSFRKDGSRLAWRSTRPNASATACSSAT